MDAMEILESRRSEIESLCRHYGVQRLRVFGSAVTGEWDSETSDFDFILEWSEAAPGSWFERFFDFKFKLESLLGRSVDLVDYFSGKRPRFQERAESQARTYFVA